MYVNMAFPQLWVWLAMQNCRRRCMVSRLRRLSGIPHPAWMGVSCWVATLLAALMNVALCTWLLVKPSCCRHTAAPCAPFSSRNTRAFYAATLLSMVGLPILCMCVTPPVTLYLMTHRCTVQRGTRYRLAVARRLPQAFHAERKAHRCSSLVPFMIVKCKGGRGVGETPTTGPLLITIEAWTALTHSTLNIFIYIYFK